jgi:hypothetical protein
LWAVQRPYEHNKHINPIRRAHDTFKSEHEGSNRGDDVFSDRWIMVFEVKFGVEDDVG